MYSRFGAVGLHELEVKHGPLKLDYESQDEINVENVFISATASQVDSVCDSITSTAGFITAACGRLRQQNYL